MFSSFSWENITFENHFDKDSWDFVFESGHRQRVYSQLVYLNEKIVAMNTEPIPPKLKKQAIEYIMEKNTC